ncbi:hypothetical protein QR680_004285 [Steinernema hermaphroditum]|uniref:RNA helicase n=1 Tax=Steinernema hermaphroditum TaxID=289476 RepID=A0AA39HN76_9BILA|nr:hypothetical protein QR680_004285 [Steinernema hermaphroditum]
MSFHSLAQLTNSANSILNRMKTKMIKDSRGPAHQKMLLSGLDNGIRQAWTVSRPSILHQEEVDVAAQAEEASEPAHLLVTTSRRPEVVEEVPPAEVMTTASAPKTTTVVPRASVEDAEVAAEATSQVAVAAATETMEIRVLVPSLVAVAADEVEEEDSTVVLTETAKTATRDRLAGEDSVDLHVEGHSVEVTADLITNPEVDSADGEAVEEVVEASQNHSKVEVVEAEDLVAHSGAETMAESTMTSEVDTVLAEAEVAGEAEAVADTVEMPDLKMATSAVLVAAVVVEVVVVAMEDSVVEMKVVKAASVAVSVAAEAEVADEAEAAADTVAMADRKTATLATVVDLEVEEAAAEDEVAMGEAMMSSTSAVAVEVVAAVAVDSVEATVASEATMAKEVDSPVVDLSAEAVAGAASVEASVALEAITAMEVDSRAAGLSAEVVAEAASAAVLEKTVAKEDSVVEADAVFVGGRGNYGGGDDDNGGFGGFGGGRGGRGGYGGGRGGYGGGDDDGDQPSFGGGRGGGRGGGFSGGFGGGFGGGAGGGFDGDDENRPPPATYIPKVKAIDTLFQEDANNAVYSDVSENDAEVIVTGIEQSKVIVCETWEDCKLPEALHNNVVERCKYARPRKIQAKTIPLIMEGYDVMGHAETGGGKTAAFLLPIMTKIMNMAADELHDPDSRCSPICLIIGPTRELVLQLSEQARKFADQTGVSVAKAYGQYNVRENLREIRSGCQILCATPGRLKHFIRNGEVRLANLKYFVLDEADHLLQNNFWEDIIEIVRTNGFPAKDERQTLLFSATFDDEVKDMSNKILREEYRVMVSNQHTSGAACKRVKQNFMLVPRCEKNNKIYEILEKELAEEKDKSDDPENAHVRRTLVFVEHKRTTDLLAAYLSTKNIMATSINGDRTQDLREKALNDFRANVCHVLVATDVCARGIDIHELEHVINYDLPNESIQYIHRIGRTGRLCEGSATSFVDPDENNPSLLTDIVNVVRGAEQEPPEFLVDLAEGRRPEGLNDCYNSYENGVTEDGDDAAYKSNDAVTEDW